MENLEHILYHLDLKDMEITREEALLSAMRALWGHITPNMRAIAVQYKKTPFLIRVYFENQPSKKEKDLLDTISSEILADFPKMSDIKEEIIVCSTRIGELNHLDSWIYSRYEE